MTIIVMDNVNNMGGGLMASRLVNFYETTSEIPNVFMFSSLLSKERLQLP